MGFLTHDPAAGHPDPRRIAVVTGTRGGPVASESAVTLPQELTFSWARTGLVTIAAVTTRQVPGQYGTRFECVASFPTGELGLGAPAIAIVLEPGESRNGTFYMGNFGNSVQMWDTAAPSRLWRSGSTGAVTWIEATGLLLQGITLRDSASGGPQANRIRLDGTLRIR